MTSGRPTQKTIRRTRVRKRRVAGLLVAIVAVAALGDQLLADPSPTSSASDRIPARERRAPHSEHRDLPVERPGAPGTPGPAAAGTTANALGEADGAVPDGTTVFDDEIRGVANLDPTLLAALRQAANDAADEGVALQVNSGWRSSKYQQHLLDEAVAKHGSRKEAARWVAPPDRSSHVSGDAVDIGPSAAAWLSRHGAAYGLCQTYGNEPWHFELRPGAPDQGCPAPYADPTQDPRLQP